MLLYTFKLVTNWHHIICHIAFSSSPDTCWLDLMKLFLASRSNMCVTQMVSDSFQIIQTNLNPVFGVLSQTVGMTISKSFQPVISGLPQPFYYTTFHLISLTLTIQIFCVHHSPYLKKTISFWYKQFDQSKRSRYLLLLEVIAPSDQQHYE